MRSSRAIGRSWPANSSLIHAASPRKATVRNWIANWPLAKVPWSKRSKEEAADDVQPGFPKIIWKGTRKSPTLLITWSIGSHNDDTQANAFPDSKDTMKANLPLLDRREMHHYLKVDGALVKEPSAGLLTAVIARWYWQVQSRSAGSRWWWRQTCRWWYWPSNHRNRLSWQGSFRARSRPFG